MLAAAQGLVWAELRCGPSMPSMHSPLNALAISAPDADRKIRHRLGEGKHWITTERQLSVPFAPAAAPVATPETLKVLAVGHEEFIQPGPGGWRPSGSGLRTNTCQWAAERTTHACG